MVALVRLDEIGRVRRGMPTTRCILSIERAPRRISTTISESARVALSRLPRATKASRTALAAYSEPSPRKLEVSRNTRASAGRARENLLAARSAAWATSNCSVAVRAGAVSLALAQAARTRPQIATAQYLTNFTIDPRPERKGPEASDSGHE